MKDVLRIALLAASVIACTATFGPVAGKSAKEIDWGKKLEKGYYELSIGNVDKAIEMFQEKVKAHSDSGACHTALGTALKKKGRLPEAKSEFAAATSAEPTFANGFYELGAMQESEKEYASAAQSFAKFEEFSNDANKKKVVEDRIRFCKEHM